MILYVAREIFWPISMSLAKIAIKVLTAGGLGESTKTHVYSLHYNNILVGVIKLVSINFCERL